MEEYKVTPIKVGSLFYYRGGFTSNQEEYKTKEEFPILIFLVEGSTRKILVDTGGGDPEEMKQYGHALCKREKEERPDLALRKNGVDPKEIDTVIMTHLHWDHCYNNHLFSEAEFIVQKKELLNAVCPLPKFRNMYETFDTGVIPPWARQGSKWKIIDGDQTLCDGIHLLLLPGHTPGLQGVLVNTAEGECLQASDAVPLYECIEGLQQEKYGISSLCDNLGDFYHTFDRLRELQEKEKVKIIASDDFLTLKWHGCNTECATDDRMNKKYL